MANYVVSDTELTAVANSIRTKGGTSASLEWPDGYVSAVEAISGGGVSETAHAIYCDCRQYFDVPVAADGGATVTITCINTTGLSAVSTLLVNSSRTGGSGLILSWSTKQGWSVGLTNSFTMPTGSDVVVYLQA